MECNGLYTDIRDDGCDDDDDDDDDDENLKMDSNCKVIHSTAYNALFNHYTHCAW